MDDSMRDAGDGPVLLHLDFPFSGPWGDAMAQSFGPLAASIAAEPGLRWKLWLEDAAAGRAGGAYLFDTRADAQRYLRMHLARLAAFGVAEPRVTLHSSNAALSAITRAPWACPITVAA